MEKRLLQKFKTKTVSFLIGALVSLPAAVHAQDTQELAGQVMKLYTGTNGAETDLIAGFSPWGLIGGILFGSIGFVAFVYGKRNALLKPMLLGISLMAYPYFVRGTVFLYIIGTALTAALYYFRE